MNKNTRISLVIFLVGFMLISTIIIYNDKINSPKFNTEFLFDKDYVSGSIYSGPVRLTDDESLFRLTGKTEEEITIKNLETGESWSSVKEYRERNN
jgi:hypothetical protein